MQKSKKYKMQFLNTEMAIAIIYINFCINTNRVMWATKNQHSTSPQEKLYHIMKLMSDNTKSLSSY